MPKCRYCKKEIEKDNSYKVGKASYYCNQECYELSQNKKDKPQTDSSRRQLTDYIQDYYLDNGYNKNEINWNLLASQIKNLVDKGMKYSGIKYCLWYMIEIKEMNLFNDDFNGSILNLVDFYYEESKRYWKQTDDIKKEIEQFDFEDNVVIVKKPLDKYNKKCYNKIDLNEL